VTRTPVRSSGRGRGSATWARTRVPTAGTIRSAAAILARAARLIDAPDGGCIFLVMHRPETVKLGDLASERSSNPGALTPV
jgi:hypothetical protein